MWSYTITQQGNYWLVTFSDGQGYSQSYLMDGTIERVTMRAERILSGISR